MKPRRSKRSRANPAPRLDIIYEDPELIAVNKPTGLLSIATDSEHSNTLHRRLNEDVERRSRGKERVFIVHRLDRDVSGIMLFAKSLAAQDALQRGWSSAEKKYLALVEGRPPEASGTIRSWLRENRAFKVYSGSEGPEAKLAVTHYRVVERLRGHALLEVLLETGRKHQIRVHLSDLGCPIVGDERYGAAKSAGGGLALCAYALAFDHPVSGERVTLSIPIPRVMRALKDRCR